MKLKYLFSYTLSIILYLLSASSGYALPWDDTVKVTITSRTAKSSKETEQYVHHFFDMLSKSNSDRKLLSEQNLKKYLSNDIHYRVNGVEAANNLESLAKRWNKVSEGLKSYIIKFPLNSLVVANNRAIVIYQYDEVRKDGKRYTNLVSVRLTFDQGKIADWNAVVEYI